jgi:aspartate racemase
MSLTLGLLGGADPAATLDFLGLIQAYTPAKSERDHLRVIADIDPRLLEADLPGASPGPGLAEMAGALRGAGADVLALASVSAHAHADLIQRASHLPMIDMISVAAGAARAAGVRRAGVLGARSALRLFREYLAAQAMGMVTLPPESQTELATTLARLRTGETGAELDDAVQRFAAELVAEGAEVVIAASTTLPRALRRIEFRVDIVDPLDLLARRCVAVCLGAEPVPHAPAD